ncbi:MAG TPA: Fe3+/spermidine/putrescine ABC transporter ATP-binding protein [Acidobacteria bacterium]|nr:Fe3+/spermidine/putrescine ABC transporter ATP-binding protein [Acidobacteriota bacterium]
MAFELVADFTKQYPGGPAVSARFAIAADVPSVTVLFGPSGSGKTTILRCLAGLERPDRGSIHFGDETWHDAARGICIPPQARRVAYLFQEYALFPHLTVEGNIGYGLRGPHRVRAGRVAELAQMLGLQGLERRLPSQISGGQRQRVALARALATEPRLLLLDEPLSALDAASRSLLRRELRTFLSHLKIPTLVVTHGRTEALVLGDRMLIVNGGRILQDGLVHEVFRRPGDLSVAEIVGVETVVPGRIVAASEGLLQVEVGAVRLVAADFGRLEDGAEVMVSIRAEEVLLERGGPSRTSARNHLEGRVLALVPEGPLVRVVVDCGFPLAALVTSLACDELELAPGVPVACLVKATAVHLIPG